MDSYSSFEASFWSENPAGQGTAIQLDFFPVSLLLWKEFHRFKGPQKTASLWNWLWDRFPAVFSQWAEEQILGLFQSLVKGKTYGGKKLKDRPADGNEDFFRLSLSHFKANPIQRMAQMRRKRERERECDIPPGWKEIHEYEDKANEFAFQAPQTRREIRLTPKLHHFFHYTLCSLMSQEQLVKRNIISHWHNMSDNYIKTVFNHHNTLGWKNGNLNASFGGWMLEPRLSRDCLVWNETFSCWKTFLRMLSSTSPLVPEPFHVRL